jgi:hypothetical protein
LPENLQIGNYLDNYARAQIRKWFISIGLPEKTTLGIHVNRRLYNQSETAYRIPDVRVGDVYFDATLAPKNENTRQIRDFGAFGNPREVIIVRPSSQGGASRIPGERLRR